MTVSEDRAGGAGRMRECDTGTVLYHQGDEGDTLYIVQQGLVALRRQRGDHEDLEQAERGDFFGELSVINAAPRDATATVVEPSRLLEIDIPTFERMLKDNAEIAVRIIRKMATRIDRLSRRPMSSEVRVALKAALKAQDPSPGGPAPRPGIEAPAAAPIQAQASWPPTAAPPATAPLQAQASWPPTAAPLQAQASWPQAPGAAPVQAPPSWPQPDPYADAGHELRRRRGSSPGVVFLLTILTLAGLVGLIAAIVLMRASTVVSP
jgi:hypothetical protein